MQPAARLSGIDQERIAARFCLRAMRAGVKHKFVGLNGATIHFNQVMDQQDAVSADVEAVW